MTILNIHSPSPVDFENASKKNRFSVEFSDICIGQIKTNKSQETELEHILQIASESGVIRNADFRKIYEPVYADKEYCDRLTLSVVGIPERPYIYNREHANIQKFTILFYNVLFKATKNTISTIELLTMWYEAQNDALVRMASHFQDNNIIKIANLNTRGDVIYEYVLSDCIIESVRESERSYLSTENTMILVEFSGNLIKTGAKKQDDQEGLNE